MANLNLDEQQKPPVDAEDAPEGGTPEPEGEEQEQALTPEERKELLALRDEKAKLERDFKALQNGTLKQAERDQLIQRLATRMERLDRKMDLIIDGTEDVTIKERAEQMTEEERREQEESQQSQRVQTRAQRIVNRIDRRMQALDVKMGDHPAFNEAWEALRPGGTAKTIEDVEDAWDAAETALEELEAKGEDDAKKQREEDVKKAHEEGAEEERRKRERAEGLDLGTGRSAGGIGSDMTWEQAQKITRTNDLSDENYAKLVGKN